MTRINVGAARRQVARIMQDSRAFERRQSIGAGVFLAVRNAVTVWVNPDTLEARICATEAASLAHG